MTSSMTKFQLVLIKIVGPRLALIISPALVVWIGEHSVQEALDETQRLLAGTVISEKLTNFNINNNMRPKYAVRHNLALVYVRSTLFILIFTHTCAAKYVNNFLAPRYFGMI